MLGCHDFCGYYDWTFAHVVQHFGNEALRDLWSNAIGADAQRHYLQAAPFRLMHLLRICRKCYK
jgi:hypothetical protein